MRVEMREQRSARLGRNIVTKLKLCRIRSSGEPLQAAPDTGRKFCGIPEACPFPGVARPDLRERRSRRRIEIDREKRPFGFPLLRIGKHLARPHRQPPIRELDLPHRQRAWIRELEK